MNTFDANIGNGIGKVLCRYNWAARSFDAGPNTTFIDDKGISVLAKRDDNTLPGNSTLPVRRTEAVSPATAVAVAVNIRNWTPVEETTNYDYMLIVCQNPNLLGKCFTLTGQGCYGNPFNVDALESLWQRQGYECAVYPAANW
jgi:hypothetical protein